MILILGPQAPTLASAHFPSHPASFLAPQGPLPAPLIPPVLPSPLTHPPSFPPSCDAHVTPPDPFTPPAVVLITPEAVEASASPTPTASSHCIPAFTPVNLVHTPAVAGDVLQTE